jgi:hypothetical protein
MSETCERRWQRNPHTGEYELHRCGRTLLDRDPTDKEQTCLGGLVICMQCIDHFEAFMTAVNDAKAVREEWGE